MTEIFVRGSGIAEISVLIKMVSYQSAMRAEYCSP